MPMIRIIDEIGNKYDVTVEFVPRIGECILQTLGLGGEPVRQHYFRVKDVLHTVDNDELNVAIFVDKERAPKHWS